MAILLPVSRMRDHRDIEAAIERVKGVLSGSRDSSLRFSLAEPPSDTRPPSDASHTPQGGAAP